MRATREAHSLFLRDRRYQPCGMHEANLSVPIKDSVTKALTILRHLDLVRQLINAHIETLLNLVQYFRILGIANERNGQTFRTETASAGNLEQRRNVSNHLSNEGNIKRHTR